MSRTSRDLSFYFEIKHNKVKLSLSQNKKNHERIKLLCDGQISKFSKVNFLRSLSEDLQVSRCAPQRSNTENQAQISSKFYSGLYEYKPLTGPTEQYASPPQLSHKAGQLVYQSFSAIEKTDSTPPLK